MYKKIKILSILLILFIGTGAFAQEDPPVIMMDYYNLDLRLPDDEIVYEEELYEGYPVAVGSTISTLDGGYAEIELYDGTIIKIDEMTDFVVEQIMDRDGAEKNIFSLVVGRFRSVVESATKGDNYQFNGISSVCGVRGTDLSMWVDAGINMDSVFILDGVVDYTNKATGQTIKVTKDLMANTFDSMFQTKAIPDDFMNILNKGLKFNKLDPSKIKGKEPEPTQPPEEKDSGADTVPDTGTDIDTIIDEEEEYRAPDMPDWLSNLLGMEIGSITIGDKTYAKAVLQPTFSVGPLKTSLYLPLIYEHNMFDPDYWYKPKGNNEWSFGTDQEEPIDMVGDFLSDLFLKIKYIQWGEQRDPFWIKVGNMSDFTIGHGLIMKNYANDADFPQIRRIGVNLGMDFPSGGFEVISNDITEIVTSPRIFGTRGYLRPFAPGMPLALGLTLIADFNPGSDLPKISVENTPTADEIGNPMFINLGFDVDYPFIESDFLSIIGFADIAAMLPYFLTKGAGAYSSITAGPHFEAIIPEDGSGVRNYGFFTGFMGNILFIDYVLDFRYFTGTFKPQFFSTAYDRSSGDRAVETADYIRSPSTSEDIVMGVYMEGGYTLDKVFSIEIGYMFPMTIDTLGDFTFMEGEDTLHAKFTISSDVIPFIDLSGSISYDRSYFLKMLAGETSPTGRDLDWFDEYTVFGGEIIYGVNDNVDIALLLTSPVSIDEETGDKTVDFAFSFETRVHF